MISQNIVIGCAVTAIVTGGVGFWGGTTYSKSQSMPNLQNRGGGRTMMQEPNYNTMPSGNRVAPGASDSQGPMGQRSTAGEVTAKDDKSITVKMNDGSSRMIILSDKTTYRTSEEASLDAIAVGTKVAVFGESGNDGSMTAASIEINPQMMGQTFKQ